jgi:PD-(D/E)XK nuclease superfamily
VDVERKVVTRKWQWRLRNNSRFIVFNKSHLVETPHIIALLQCIKRFNDTVTGELERFICNANLSALARNYEANLKKRNVDLGFNLFAIISELYYRENFHSDILKAFLDPKAKHQEHEKYLHLFLEFIGSHGAKINLSDYSNVQVEREEGRVDLLIKDKDSKKAIIVENKINNAVDMHRQLPRYLEYVRANDYVPDAIIYLRLNGYTYPDTTGWSSKEIKEVKTLITIVSAYDETQHDLLTGWIRKCEKASTNPDAQYMLRQYGGLIKKLGGNVMNKPIMEKFYKTMVEGENLKTALSLKAMLDDLVLYRVENIIDTFKSDLSPFRQINNWKDSDAYFMGVIWKDAHLGIDINVEPELYLFQFWDREDRPGTKGHAKAILEKMGCLNEYTFKDGSFFKKFAFPSQEDDLIKHITVFKNKLAEVIVP